MDPFPTPRPTPLPGSFGLTSKEKIQAACECFPDLWSAEEDEFQVEKLTGGLTNLLTLVKRSPHKKPKVSILEADAAANNKDDDEDNIVLIREYGQGSDVFMNRAQESHIIKALSDMNLCPKIYKLFPWGRVEKFLQHSRTLTTQEYRSPSYLPLVGKLLGTFHSNKDTLLKLTSSDNKDSVLKPRLVKWFKLAVEMKFSHNKMHKLAGMNLASVMAEIDWLCDVAIPSLQSNQIVFAHCDLQEGNVLVRNQDSELLEVNMIDLEYGDRMERGFDLGNCFCEMTISYAIKGFPGFCLNPDHFPENAAQDLFLQGYCLGAGLDFEFEKQGLKNEAKLFCLVSHLHWAIWSVIMAGNSTIEFGYLEYALQRMDQYWALKKKWKDDLVMCVVEEED